MVGGPVFRWRSWPYFQSALTAALVEATLGINAFLADTELRATVVLAIRSDMFGQLPSTDSAKLTDHAVELDWSKGGLGDGNELWKMLNGKAIASVSPLSAASDFETCGPTT